MVTGGAGFIGSHLVDRLVEEGANRIVVVDNLFLGDPGNVEDAMQKSPGVIFHNVDATDEDRLGEIIRKERVTVLFALATIPLPASLERPKWSSDVIWQLGMAAAELARKGQVEKLVHCSSSEAYGSAQYTPMDEEHPLAVETPYAAAKASADLLVRSYVQTFDLDAVIVRPFNTYGPRQNDKSFAGLIPIIVRRIQQGQPPVLFGDGLQTRDYQYVTDTADAIVRLSMRDDIKGQQVNIASGQEVTIKELVERVCAAMGYEGSVKRAPERIADVRRHLADVARLDSLLGPRQVIGLEEGIARTVAWYLEQSAHRLPG